MYIYDDILLDSSSIEKCFREVVEKKTHKLYVQFFFSKIVSFVRLCGKYGLFQITNLMHNSFILQQYVCYTTILNMFRAARCSSTRGQIVSPQPLVSSPSVNSRTICRLRADGSTKIHLLYY